MQNMYKKVLMRLRFLFGFSHTETNGFVVLSLLMLVSIMAPFVSRFLLAPPAFPKVNAQEAHYLDSLIATLESNVKSVSEEGYHFTYFDPNQVAVDTLLSFGLPAYLANRVLNFREKVHPYRQKEDLLKIYGMDSSLYQKMEPFIVINRQEERSKSIAFKPKEVFQKDSKEGYYAKPTFTSKPFYLNDADTLQLKQVYGIGSVLSKRIIAYRNALGGFYSLDQLKEVYGLKEAAYDSLKNRSLLKADEPLRKIGINQLDVEEIAGHPYISKKQAKLVVAYRSQHGAFYKSQELLAIPLFDSLSVAKLTPYLSFEK